jgi:Rrf2 family transcriptional regulator, nitric oxide-sensitive transcriptional repressor
VRAVPHGAARYHTASRLPCASSFALGLYISDFGINIPVLEVPLILHISEAANLGLHALAYLARNSDGTPVTTAVIAEAYGVSEAHLSKVFQRLAKAGLVKSVRGPRGGFKLRRAPGEITLREIYEALDGPLLRSACLFSEPKCGLTDCLLGDLLSDVHQRIAARFSNTTLADVAAQ